MSVSVITVGILTISDRSFRGERDDRGSPVLKSVARRMGWRISAEEVVPDEIERIQMTLLNWTDDRKIDLVLTTGGTGIAPRDVTPEATNALLEKELPGLMEHIRFQTTWKMPLAVLSRAVAGTRKKSLIINLPGNPDGAKDCLESILNVIPHALAVLCGQDHSHKEGKGETLHVDA